MVIRSAVVHCGFVERRHSTVAVEFWFGSQPRQSRLTGNGTKFKGSTSAVELKGGGSGLQSLTYFFQLLKRLVADGDCSTLWTHVMDCNIQSDGFAHQFF